MTIDKLNYNYDNHIYTEPCFSTFLLMPVSQFEVTIQNPIDVRYSRFVLFDNFIATS